MTIKQVPAELIGGKILWAHPDGYFLNAKGQKVLHTYSPCARRGIRHSVNGNRGSCYPCMRQLGGKSCHFLMCVTFHGPRPEGCECDHINGDKLDYRPANLEWVTPGENRRRAKILRGLRAAGRDPKTLSTEELHALFRTYTVVDISGLDSLELNKHYDPFVERN